MYAAVKLSALGGTLGAVGESIPIRSYADRAVDGSAVSLKNSTGETEAVADIERWMTLERTGKFTAAQTAWIEGLGGVVFADSAAFHQWLSETVSPV